MELFHEYYSGQCQLVLDILARAKAESRFTRGELESIYGEDWANRAAPCAHRCPPWSGLT